MNKHIKRLVDIQKKKERTIIGLMSGTSFDGLDIALCKIENSGTSTKLKLAAFKTYPFDKEFKNDLLSIFSRHDADLEKVCLMNVAVAHKHAMFVNRFLNEHQVFNNEIDLIASHGQTIYHAPKFLHGTDRFPNATLQIGDGDHIAVGTGIITISDFRQKHIAAGGEGAPLAVYGDYLVFSEEGENRIMLNIGGIANFTFLSGDLDPAKVYSTDVGPGNTMMDAYVQKKYNGKFCDINGELARKGSINQILLSELKNHSFFKKTFPKTIGPELFNLSYLQNAVDNCNIKSLSDEDIIATLNRFSADCIAEAILSSIKPRSVYHVYVSGGGIHNQLLMENIMSQLPGIQFHTTDELDVLPDAKEAVLFALLANECVCGIDYRFGIGIPNVSMGKISFPD